MSQKQSERERVKELPDSLVSFEKKRFDRVKDAAMTKFMESLFKFEVNRTDLRFDVFVKNDVREKDITDFEKMWPMCKVCKIEFV